MRGVNVYQTVVSQVPLLCRLDLCCKADGYHNLGFSLRHAGLAATSRPTRRWASHLPSGIHWVRGRPRTNDNARINSLVTASV